MDISLKNVSARTIVAYVLILESKNEAGLWRPSAIGKIIRLSDPADPTNIDKVYPPGKAWQHTRPLATTVGAGRKELDYRVTIDYVHFDDGSSWGADVSKEGANVRSFLSGYRAAEGHYRQKLQREGPQAVERELSAPRTK